MHCSLTTLTPAVCGHISTSMGGSVGCRALTRSMGHGAAWRMQSTGYVMVMVMCVPVGSVRDMPISSHVVSLVIVLFGANGVGHCRVHRTQRACA